MDRCAVQPVVALLIESHYPTNQTFFFLHAVQPEGRIDKVDVVFAPATGAVGSEVGAFAFFVEDEAEIVAGRIERRTQVNDFAPLVATDIDAENVESARSGVAVAAEKQRFAFVNEGEYLVFIGVDSLAEIDRFAPALRGPFYHIEVETTVTPGHVAAKEESLAIGCQRGVHGAVIIGIEG